jgi:hypothetical protein
LKTFPGVRNRWGLERGRKSKSSHSMYITIKLRLDHAIQRMSSITAYLAKTRVEARV